MKTIDNLRPTFLKLGLIISVSLVILAFNLTVYDEEPPIQIQKEFAVKPIIEIVRTSHKKKKVLPPPPKVQLAEIDEDVFDDVVFSDEPLIKTESVFDSTMMVNETTSGFPVGIGIESDAPEVVIEPPKEDENVYHTYQVEKLPFMGDCYGMEKEEMQACAYAAFKKFMAENIKYPALARENNIQGTVHVQFVIGKTGKIEDVQIRRGISGGCSEEVLRVIGQMPRWSPGIQGGRPVKVMYTAPVSFKLQ